MHSLEPRLGLALKDHTQVHWQLHNPDSTLHVWSSANRPPSMEKLDTSPQYASPKEVAGKIAALSDQVPATLTVSMVGSAAVEIFVREIMAAQANTHSVPLDLD